MLDIPYASQWAGRYTPKIAFYSGGDLVLRTPPRQVHTLNLTSTGSTVFLELTGISNV